MALVRDSRAIKAVYAVIRTMVDVMESSDGFLCEVKMNDVLKSQT